MGGTIENLENDTSHDWANEWTSPLCRRSLTSMEPYCYLCWITCFRALVLSDTLPSQKYETSVEWLVICLRASRLVQNCR